MRKTALCVSIINTSAILLVFALLNSCQSVIPQSTPVKPVVPQTPVSPVEPSNTEDNQNSFIYEKEGFVSRDAYVVIIVQPFSTSETGTDIESKAKKRALTSLLKYKHSQGKILSQNGTTQIVNLINENGKLTRIDDSEKSRSVFQFVVKKTNLKQIVDSL